MGWADFKRSLATPEPGMKRCWLCGGRGKEPDLTDKGVASYTQKWVPCDECGGTGRQPRLLGPK